MNFDFKLCKSAIDGLKLLNTAINSEISKKLLASAIKQIFIVGLALPPKPDLYEEKADLSKQADFGICSLLILSAKHNVGSNELKSYLIEQEIKRETVEQVVEMYEKYKDDIQSRLETLGNSHNIPLLTNCTWELNYNIKSNSSDQSELEYKINFQSFDQKSGTHQTITEFTCNPEELTFLLNKLKDVERHCEKLALNK